MTDEAGWKIAAHDYYPFGMEMTSDDGAGSRRRFTGHERDGQTGLDYMLARYCTVSLARFLSVDPAVSGANSRQPKSWNRYTHVFNNPLTFFDRATDVLIDPDTTPGGFTFGAES